MRVISHASINTRSLIPSNGNKRCVLSKVGLEISLCKIILSLDGSHKGFLLLNLLDKYGFNNDSGKERRSL